MANNDNTVILEMMDIFKEQSEEFNNDFKKYLEENNYMKLSLLAHKVKSSAAIMGMTDFAKKLKYFEQITKEEKYKDQYQEFIDIFEDIFKQANKEIEDLKLTLKS